MKTTLDQTCKLTPLLITGFMHQKYRSYIKVLIVKQQEGSNQQPLKQYTNSIGFSLQVASKH